MDTQNLRRIIFWAGIVAAFSIKAETKILKPKQILANSFAIITDDITYEKTKDAMLLYKAAVENDGLSTYIISSAWQNPEEIREEIIRLKKADKTLEGFVLVGDIPVACIRNAQHMTTAFKMNEETFPFPESSVPSDRFYDDLHLKFDYIRRDSVTPHLFYYKLSENSPQSLNPELYSARIRYPEKKGGDKYNAISDFLRKAAKAKNEKFNTLDHFVSFTGSAYNSECLTAWIDEGKALRENFPYAWTSGTSAKHLNFRMDNFMKYRLFDELQRPEVDLFVFHEHGLPDAQLINNEPDGISFDSRYDAFRRSVYSDAKRMLKRSKLPKDSVLNQLAKKYSVQKEFFNALNDKNTAEKDSTTDADLYINLTDLNKISTYPKAVILDACYNGSFHLDDYVAGYYIFNPGNTLVVSANSRNVLQDKWTMEFTGLLSYGARFGQYFRLISTLEGHLMGDPTVKFSPATEITELAPLIYNTNDSKANEKALNSSKPDLQALALRNLAHNDKNKKLSGKIFQVYKTSAYNVVRMEALKLLSEYNDQNFVKALALALTDPYEFVARQAAVYCGENGDESLIIPMASAYLNYPERLRVLYNIQSSFSEFPLRKVIHVFDSLLNASNFTDKETIRKDLNEYFKSTDKRLNLSLKNIADPSLPVDKRISDIRTIRNYNYHYNTGEYLRIMKNDKDDIKVRVALAEALGWFTNSYKKDEIVKSCRSLLQEKNLPAELHAELIQTMNRLQ